MPPEVGDLYIRARFGDDVTFKRDVALVFGVFEPALFAFQASVDHKRAAGQERGGDQDQAAGERPAVLTHRQGDDQQVGNK